MELYDEGFETEGYHRQRGSAHPKLRIRTSLFSAIEVCRILMLGGRLDIPIYE